MILMWISHVLIHAISTKYNELLTFYLLKIVAVICYTLFYIKTWHGFVSNHSKCQKCVYSKTHLNFKTYQSENFNLMKTENGEWYL